MINVQEVDGWCGGTVVSVTSLDAAAIGIETAFSSPRARANLISFC